MLGKNQIKTVEKEILSDFSLFRLEIDQSLPGVARNRPKKLPEIAQKNHPESPEKIARNRPEKSPGIARKNCPEIRKNFLIAQRKNM